MMMKKIEDLWKQAGIDSVCRLCTCPVNLQQKNRVNILALGDVGVSVLTGLRVLGGDVISEIGICDMSVENMRRLEMEMNQIRYPFGTDCGDNPLPPVRIVSRKELFDCDVFVFCASKGVPPLSEKGDVRMIQLSANREIIESFAEMAKASGYRGLAAVVSDPVDPLCAAFLKKSGLEPSQVQGYGLGVMNSRALYYAEKDPRFASYKEEGRAYGPHGADLVLANSLTRYDRYLSEELTALVTGANLKVRELGYKPFIAPAWSSAAIPILLTLRGQWHYSSLYLGDGNRGAFFGMKNRMTRQGPEYEDAMIPETLFDRMCTAYNNLLQLQEG